MNWSVHIANFGRFCVFKKLIMKFGSAVPLSLDFGLKNGPSPREFGRVNLALDQA